MKTVEPSWLEEDRPLKRKARRLALLEDQEAVEPKRGAILLPATTLMDVQIGLQTGTFDYATHFHLVERDHHRFPVMSQNAEKLGIKKTLYHKELSDVPLADRIDYAFLDFNGGIVAPTFLWMRNVLGPKLLDGADIALTVMYSYRDNYFMKATHDFFMETPNRREWYERLSESYGLYNNPFSTDYLALMAIAFPKHDMIAETPPYRYSDTTIPMLLYRFFDLKRRKSDQVPFANDFLEFAEAESKKFREGHGHLGGHGPIELPPRGICCPNCGIELTTDVLHKLTRKEVADGNQSCSSAAESGAEGVGNEEGASPQAQRSRSQGKRFPHPSRSLSRGA